MLNGSNTQLETKRLVLRPMLETDIDALHLIFTDPKVMASFGGELLSRAEMERWLARNLEHQRQFGYGLFSVILKRDGTLIGDCGLERMDEGDQTVAELGYDFRSDYWHQGYATEAAIAMRDYAFQTLAKFDAEYRSGLGYHQPAGALASLGVMGAGSGATQSKYVARRETPVYIAENCTQCMECITACPDTALPNTSQEIGTVLTTAINNYVTGITAFTHKAGIHAKAILNNPETYEALDPRDFGLTRYISITHKLTGWNAVKDRAEQLGLSLTDAQLKAVTAHIKDLADHKPIDLEDVDELLHRWADGSGQSSVDSNQ